MCYKPIRIVSNKIDFDARFDKVYFEVPCGKCCECQSAKVQSWSLRNYYEFLNCKNHNGTVFNFTLTYNDEHLPKQFGISTFDKTDIQKFLKLLRKWLVKDGLMPKESLRYFVTSEYGHLFSRPHYHIIFYIMCPINPYLFYKYVCKYWNRGFVGYGSLGMEVKDFHALQYACKYITKDSSYKSVIDAVKKKYAELTDDKDMIYFDDFFKRFRQFHLESKGFGSCMLNYVTESQLYLGSVLSPFDTSGKKSVPVPLYILRKVFYDEVKQEDGTIRYVLNKKGIYKKITNISNQIINANNKLSLYRQYPNDFHLLCELEEDSVDSFFSHLDTYFHVLELPIYSLFVYKYIYRDRYLDEDTISNNPILDYSKFLFRFSEIPQNKINSLKNYNDVYKNIEDIANYQQIFRTFERFLGKLQAFKRYDAYQTQLRTIKDYNIKQSQVALARGSKPCYKDLPCPKEFFTYYKSLN